MKIRQVVVYEVDGQQFRHIEKAHEHLENKLGALIDKLPTRLGVKSRLEILDLLIQNRAELLDLLDGEILDSADDFNCQNKNIYDVARTKP